MKNEPYFFWCHSSEDTEPVLYAISNPSPHAVFYLGRDHQDAPPKWYRSSCWTETTLTTQFNNPKPGDFSRFVAVDPCELLFNGVDVPPVPSSNQPKPAEPPPHVFLTPDPVKWDYKNFEFSPSFRPLQSTAKLASDIADSGRYQERRATINYLRNLADVLENSIPKK